MKIVQVTQSPMNAERWLLTLECRHERWITSKKRPSRKKIACSVCDVASAMSDAKEAQTA